jgi:hypothetical protein
MSEFWHINNNLKFRKMETKKLTLLLALLICSAVAFGQTTKQLDIAGILKSGKLPQNLELKNDLQKFVVTTDHFNTDIFANFFNKFRTRGEYTRGLPGDMVKWNNVTVAMSMARNAKFAPGTPIGYMENFTYKVSEDMMKPEKFSTFNEHSAFTKNLVWDMMAIEGFTWAYFNELELNKPYKAGMFNGKIDLAGTGSFENKDVILTWTGITKLDGEYCAAIEFRTMNNPMDYTGEGMSMKGRSHYWGTIWVSVEDKQVEHAVLFEDVVMEIQLPGQTGKQIMDATREITYEKVL